MSKKEITREENEPITMEIVKNTIPQIIEDFCIKYNIDDLTRESSNRFNALLIEINKQLIEPNKKQLLKLPNGANNKYNTDALYELLEIYINLCMLYDNAVTITGFSLLCNMKYDTIVGLQHEHTPRPQYNTITGTTYTTRRAGLEVWKKLMELEEQTTLDCRKYNDLRIIARLNRITGGAYRDYTQVDTGASKPTATPQSIADKYGDSANAGLLPTE